MNSFILIAARALKIGSALALAATLAACSGSGAPTTENPVTSAPPVSDYTGPVAQNADIQAFSLELWEKVKPNNRCGACHNAGGQPPTFARNDDVNAAYQAANTIVNLAQPDQSRMVLKVAGGHNCWLASASACGDTLTVWIRNWAGAAATGGRQIELQEPDIVDVGDSKTFPATSAEFQASLLWNDPANLPSLLRKYCARCHSPTAAGPIQPFFASNDPDEAYAAVKSKINLDNPAISRLVVRLRSESHNCWSDCATNANTMEAAVRSFTDAIPLTQVDPALITSKALKLFDGTVAAGGNRFDNNVIALYEFKTGELETAYDTSGVEPALDLTLTHPSEMWVGGWGINIKAGQRAYGTTGTSSKLAEKIKASGEFSVEAWLAPANVVQEDAYAVTYSGGATARNFTLAQRGYQYEALTRTSENDPNGMPTLLTNANDRDAQAALQHVVLTYDPINGRRLYVNGNYTGDVDSRGGGGSLADWDDSFNLVLGAETSGDFQWQGVIRLVAIHNRALTLPQVQQNFIAGVGERYFLLFNVSHLVDVPKAYVMLEGSQYDSYSYLFTRPTFISLEPNASVANLDIAGIRVGVNGAEARVGQSYIPLSTTVGGANYIAGSGQLLTSAGAVIAQEKGPADDLFFLTFERIGSRTHTVTEPSVAASPPTDSPDAPQFGMRTFDEINATFSKLTGVSITSPTVVSTFANVKQQLPGVESIDAFLASHQTGIAQLAIAYCSAMVDNTTLRTSFFGNDLDVSQQGSYFTVQANRDKVVNALYTKLVGALDSQPTQAEIATEVNNLLSAVAAGPTGSATNGSGTATKAACAAVLGSAATTVH